MTTVHPLTDGAFVLPPDVLLIPVTDLSEGVREGLSFDEGDIAVTRPNGRASSVILDPSSADLLRSFERPTPIVDAVIALSRDRALDPEETLESAYPVLESLLRSGFLVAEGTAGAAPIEASLNVGDTFEGFEVLEVRQVLEDSEVYRVRGGDGTEGALKLLRKGAERAGPKLRREAEILARLDGRASAGLVAAGEADDRPYLVLDWCEGDLVTSVADDLRFEGSRGDLLKLCRNLLAAYVHLHGQGVLHSDVHPRNLLADEDQGIKILDFDYARIPDDDGPLSAAPRGGVAHYFDPEFAGALLRGTQPPPSTPQGEEYALGALLYRLWTGSSYIEMPAEKKALLRGIVGTPPRPFEEVGEDPWGAFERVLGKALEKDPADRHGSIADFLAAFDRATRDPAGPSRQDTRTGRGSRGAAGRDFLKETFGALDPAGGLFTQGFPRGPHASINYGAGGVAFALYRMAQVRGSADLLQWADRWCRRALQLADGPEAFSNDAMSLPADTVGQVSPYHSITGLHLTEALIAHAAGDQGTRHRAIADFVRTSRRPCDNLDLVLGRTGTLLACALLWEAVGHDPGLAALGADTLADLWRAADGAPGLRQATGPFDYVGLAHGWGGLVYATLRWCAATGTALPDGLPQRLHELDDLAEPDGKALRWRITLGALRRDAAPSDYFVGWCNGTTGFVFLGTLAHRVTGDERYLRWAEGAARFVWRSRGGVSTLCCGAAGEAYAFLDLFQHTGEGLWQQRAWVMLERALKTAPAATDPLHFSLYKGALGAAVLAADLEAPAWAAMPVFGEERWPKG